MSLLAKPITVAHLFYEVYMGWSHASLLEVLKNSGGIDHLERGEVAIFLNNSWTAVKIMGHGNTLLYHRTGGKSVALETIRYLPTIFGGTKLSFTRNLEAHLLKEYEAKFGKHLKRLQVVNEQRNH